MNCPTKIAGVLSEILRTGLLQIRIAGWEGNGDLAAELADHLHNLPSLLTDFSEERLAYYWEAERTSFRESVDEGVSHAYSDLWKQLEPHIAAIKTIPNTAESQ